MPPLPLPPVIDYTNKDFTSLRTALFELARIRLPEWTDRSPADLGMLLIDQLCYVADVVLYYQDRLANESYLHTAVERRSVINHLRLIGYELSPAQPASCSLDLLFEAPQSGESPEIVIESGTQFSSTGGQDAQIFEYLGPDLTVNLDSDQVEKMTSGLRLFSGLPVRNSRRVPPKDKDPAKEFTVIGSSTGEPNQRFPLALQPVILDSLVVQVDEGAGGVTWTRRESLLHMVTADGQVPHSGGLNREYYVQFDANDVAWVIFGDGLYGRRPPSGINNIRVSYHIGGGAAGNVPANTITDTVKPLKKLKSVRNPFGAGGGTDRESIESAVRFGPLYFRSGQRAVALDDYAVLAHRAGGVAKVRAFLFSWNQIDLYIAPEGETVMPVPEELRRRLLAFFEDRRMAGMTVRICDAVAIPIAIKLEVVVQPIYRADDVRALIDQAVRKWLALPQVDFGQTLYLSDLYATVEAVPGVRAVTVTRFRRVSAAPRAALADPPPSFGSDELLSQLSAKLGPVEAQRLLSGLSIPPQGRLALAPCELPYLELQSPAERFQIAIKEGF